MIATGKGKKLDENKEKERQAEHYHQEEPLPAVNSAYIPETPVSGLPVTPDSEAGSEAMDAGFGYGDTSPGASPHLNGSAMRMNGSARLANGTTEPLTANYLERHDEAHFLANLLAEERKRCNQHKTNYNTLKSEHRK